MKLFGEQFNIIQKMNKATNLIFDFDGTLVDTQIDIKESLKKAIYSITDTLIDTISIRIGPPLEEMIRSLLITTNINEIKEIVTSFRTIYRGCGFLNTYCYSDIEKLITNLKQNGRKLYIATNKPAYLTNEIIRKLNIGYFDDIATIDSIEGSVISKKEMISLIIERNNLNRKSTFMIGDTRSDIMAATENYIASIGVGYGYEAKELLLEAKPDFYFDSVAQLADFLN
jgi:phosphoglycolate phosphatase